jgi:hypothetical protein
MSIDKKINYEDQRLTEKQKKKIKPANQGGGPNYLGKQETVTVPKKWLSDPDHVVAELAYITPKEKKILLEKNLYGSLKGKPNRGPGGVQSLQGDLGGYDASPGGPNSGGGGGNRVGQGDKNKQRVQDILRGNVTTGQTVAVSDRTRRGAVPEYAFGPNNQMKYIGSAYKSFGQPGFLDRIGGFFSRAPSGYRSVYNTRPGSGIFGTSFFGKPDITFNQGAGQYQFTDPRTGDVKPGIGGRILGGILSLVTGVPFVGSMIGNAIDKYKPKSMYEDMSQYNRLGLFGVDPVLTDNYSNMKISDTSFSPTNQPLFDVNEVQQMIENARSLPGNNLRTEVTKMDLQKFKQPMTQTMDYDTYKSINPGSTVTPYEFEQLKQGNITQPGTYVG